MNLNGPNNGGGSASGNGSSRGNITPPSTANPNLNLPVASMMAAGNMPTAGAGVQQSPNRQQPFVSLFSCSSLNLQK